MKPLSASDLPLVSVITVVRNGAATISRTIESVRSQREVDVEHVIVDGASSDLTVEQITAGKHGKLRWISEQDKSIYDAMNKGIGMARGEWILFLGADDQLADGNVLRDLFSDGNQSNYKLLCGRSKYINGKICVASLNWHTLIFNTAQHQAVLYHRSLFGSFRYRIDIPIIADYELNFLAYYKKLPTRTFERDISVCGNTGVSQTANHYVAQINAFRIRTRYIKTLFNIGLLSLGFANVLATQLRGALGYGK